MKLYKCQYLMPSSVETFYVLEEETKIQIGVYLDNKFTPFENDEKYHKFIAIANFDNFYIEKIL